MALDFPNSPSTGQVFTSPNGTIWQWDGVKWVALTSTTAVAYSGIGRNLIHNAGFTIAQRGVGPFTTSNYMLDRWALGMVADTVSVSPVALSDADRAAIGDEAAITALQDVFTGNAAAGAYHQIYQPIEGVRRLAGKSVTLSFWAKASSGAPKIGINIAQSFGTGGAPSAGVRATATSVTLATAWARYAVTIAVPSASGKTLGTNGNDYNALELWFSCGANNNAIAGSIGVQSGTIQLWGVQLEVGSVMTQLEKRDPVLELQQCQRFYQWGLFGVTGSCGNAGAGCSYVQPFVVQMRATPTMTASATSSVNMSGTNINPNGVYSFTPFGITVGANAGYIWSGTFTASADL